MSKFFDGELLSGYEESPKTTIFGEEHFIDTAMIKLVQQKNEAVDNYIFEQMANSLKGSALVEMPQVIIDKEKLKKWVVLCMKLENIEHSELIDMATKKRIADLEAKLTESKNDYLLLEEQLENANEWNKDFQKENKQLKQQLAEKDEMLNSDYYKMCPRCKNPYGASQFPSKDENGKKIYVCSNCNEKELFYEPLIKQLEEQNDRLIKERDDANLKLAESEKRIELADCIIKQYADKDKNLYLQLAEKEKQIEELNKEFVQAVKDWKSLVEQKNRDISELEEHDNLFHNQFAVEKLKETQIYVDNQHFMSARYKCEKKVYADIWNFIDNQIKQLKEGK